MTIAFNAKAPKKACNLSIDADLLREARALGINLSQTLEGQLERLVREARARDWAEENREAIEARHRWVAENGLWSDRLRQF